MINRVIQRERSPIHSRSVGTFEETFTEVTTIADPQSILFAGIVAFGNSELCDSRLLAKTAYGAQRRIPRTFE
jgi:hypothetical protein